LLYLFGLVFVYVFYLLNRKYFRRKKNKAYANLGYYIITCVFTCCIKAITLEIVLLV